jgi:hypothetical protein
MKAIMRRLQRRIQNLEFIEFWLTLPLVGFFFWLGGSAIARQVLHSSYPSPNQLQADTQLEMKLSVIVINAEINPRLSKTAVSIKTTESRLKKLEYEFPSTEPQKVEAAIAQEIGLPSQEVRKLVRYRIAQ